MNLSKIFLSSVQKKIILFFHKNQSSIDTARGISTWIDSDLKDVEIALKELARIGILVVHKTSSTIGYAYTQNKRIITNIENYIKANFKL